MLNSKVIKYEMPRQLKKVKFESKLRVLYTANQEKVRVRMRIISTYAERILDAPEILDDYYINFIHQSKSIHFERYAN